MMRIFFGAGPATFAPAECVWSCIHVFVRRKVNPDYVAVGGLLESDRRQATADPLRYDIALSRY